MSATLYAGPRAGRNDPFSRQGGRGQGESPMLLAALAYASRLGWPVFPCCWITEAETCSCGFPDCSSRGKHPLPRRGFKEASRDQAQIRTWWSKWPAANIGIPTGAVSGFDALDVDPRHGGEESLAELELRHGKLPNTVVAITGGGGRHLLFRHREGVSNKAGFLPGMDVRGDGGYILAAPSGHASGRRYQWGSRPGEVELAEWPVWLRELVQKPAHEAQRTPPPAPQEGQSGAYGRAALQGEVERVRHAPPGQQESTLNAAALKIGTLVGAGALDHGEALAALVEAGRQMVNQQGRPPWTTEQVCKKVEHGLADGMKQPRAVPDLNQRAGVPAVSNGHPPKQAAEPPQECPTAHRLADVEPEEVSWLWWPRIPLRHLTTLEGDPGEGKTFAAQAIATAVSLGKGLPGMDPTEPANALLLAAEDHAGCTIRPRLEALGADLKRVFCCTDGFTLDTGGLETLEGLLKETRPRLVVLDPLTAYLPSNLDLHRANEVRAPLKALATLAERYDCAILIVRHLAKGSTSKAIYRGLGTIDITAAARSALLAGHDPDNRDSRAIVQIKSNLGPLADPVGYNIEVGRFTWTGSTGLTAGQILAPEVEDGALSEARRFLRELLSEGARPAGEVEDEGKAAGISSSTLRRAKKALGIKVSKVGFDGAWHWSLPVEEGVL